MGATDDLRELIEDAQRGDVRAFELLVSNHLSRIRRYARAFAASDSDTDDLAQEALVKVYKNLRQYRFGSAFTTWVYAVTRNALLDAARSRQSRERASEDPLIPDQLPERSDADPADVQLSREQERQRVWAAVRQLPLEFRSAVVLFDIEGHSLEEVAAIESVPVGTVKSRLSRGRAQLRTLLGETSGTPETEVASKAR